ncbi:hypothetical protein JYU34_021281 [Plutella xylostella]|uniref:Uncharacterized protein n=1 Tax=Plutella xylostella TaxID=51655 RepID=A0ABQ7PTG0_PLUXY|nr:hypothetical protein JYU34_021281 [Plutella xylostella]
MRLWTLCIANLYRRNGGRWRASWRRSAATTSRPSSTSLRVTTTPGLSNSLERHAQAK